MKFWSKICSMLPLWLLISLANAQQPPMAVPDAGITPFKEAKPYVLEVRYGSAGIANRMGSAEDFLAQGGGVSAGSTEPSAEFLKTANALTVGVAPEDRGFVSADQMTFGYSVTPERDAGLFAVQYSNEYGAGEQRLMSRGSILLKLGEWVVVSGVQHIHRHPGGQQQEQSFQVAIRLSENTI